MTPKKKGMVRKAVNKSMAGMKKAGGRMAHAVAETPKLIALRRQERALRSEMDDHMHTIGRRVFSLHKRARGESPFSRYKAIMSELEMLTRVEEEFRTNRTKLAQLREEMRHHER